MIEFSLVTGERAKRGKERERERGHGEIEEAEREFSPFPYMHTRAGKRESGEEEESDGRKEAREGGRRWKVEEERCTSHAKW